MALTVSIIPATPFFASGSISFSELRTNFKGSASGTVKASELLRNTDLTNKNPIVPDATENESISDSLNLSLSQFRNTIKSYQVDQGSGDTDENLDISDSSLWNGNLEKSIRKVVNLSGTCGSTNSFAAAIVDAATANLFLQISGSILGKGGSPGGNGGDAISINNTSLTGKVYIKTTESAEVYGGGGGGANGGKGGKGGTGRRLVSGSRTVFKGNSGGKYNLNPPYYSMCQEACKQAYGSSAYCSVGCYLTPGQSGCGCPCWSNEGGRFAECNCCYASESYSYYQNSTPGSGGATTTGGLGEGYNQSKTNSINSLNLGGDKSAAGAGDGGNSGTAGNGGDWGKPGTGGTADDTDYNGIKGEDGNTGDAPDFGDTDGPEYGSEAGSPGAAVSGTGYEIDTEGVEDAYIGSR
jgi:hypothetical protein